MMDRGIGLNPQGWPFIGLCGLGAVVFAILDAWFPAVLALCGCAFLGHIFREPVRIGPDDAEAVAAPLDGEVLRVARDTDPVSGEKRQVVSVLSKMLDSHAVLMPVSGKVESLALVDGLKESAAGEDAPMTNERIVAELVGKGNQRFTLVLVAGKWLREPRCYAEKGDKLKRGDVLGGLVRRVELFLPEGFAPAVAEGDRVLSGQTPLAKRSGDPKA